MEASRAATGMLEVLATRVVRFMIDSVLPFSSTVSWRGKKIGHVVSHATGNSWQTETRQSGNDL